MARVVYRKISCLVTNEGVAARGGVRPVEEDLGLISRAAVAFDDARGGILWVGPDRLLPKTFRGKAWPHADCRGLTAYPGLVDAHTHPVFAGDRAQEFQLRMQGARYSEIAAAGGGIHSSVRATRAAGPATLLRLLRERLGIARRFGVRLMEAKSGYGLDRETELRSLDVIRKASRLTQGLELVPTCLAAHAIPPDRERSAYIDEITGSLLPEISRKRLAEYVDVFCDQGFFTVAECLRIMDAAHSLRLSTRIHGEELALTGIARSAAERGAHSVDHLLKIDDAGIDALAAAGTVAVLLPGTSLYLREAPAPARKLIERGAIVALATDFNPGTSPTQNLPFIGSLAAIQLGMTTPEIIAALTWNAARSLRRESRYGTALPGSCSAPVFARGDHPSALFYALAPDALPDPLSSTL